MQRHQSPERPILRQISSLIYPKIQRRQVIMSVLHPGCARPPRWSPPVQRGGSKTAWLAPAFSSIRARCPKKVRQRDLMMDESCGWLVMRQMSAFLIKSCPTYVQDSSYAPLVHGINPLYIRPVSLPAFRSTKHYREYEDPVQMDLGLVLYSHKV